MAIPIAHTLQPANPEGTPVVQPQVCGVLAAELALLNAVITHAVINLACTQDLPSRPRRNRRSETFRSAMRESFLRPANFILPIFVHDEGDKNVPISSMPGQYRLAYGKNVIENVAEARSYGVNQVVIFPKVSFPAVGEAEGGARPRGGAGKGQEPAVARSKPSSASNCGGAQVLWEKQAGAERGARHTALTGRASQNPQQYAYCTLVAGGGRIGRPTISPPSSPRRPQTT